MRRGGNEIVGSWQLQQRIGLRVQLSWQSDCEEKISYVIIGVSNSVNLL
jgi:hypothetical protein